MNIGIDIDGVLTDFEKFMIDYGSKFCFEEQIDLKIQGIYYDECKIFNWTEEQSTKFWNKYLVKYIIESKPREFAKEIIDKLQKEGNKIYLITARDETGMPKEYYGKMQDLTNHWLKNNNIKYDKLIYAKDSEKLQQCIENKVDIMIEDSPQNIQNISSKINVIKYDCQYNEQEEGARIIKAYSWYHIYNIIKKMKGE